MSERADDGGAPDYPYLEREDIAACLDFAARQARREELPIRRDEA